MKTNTALLWVLIAILFAACGPSKQAMDCPQFYKKKHKISHRTLAFRSIKKVKKESEKASKPIQLPHFGLIDAPEQSYPETVSLHGLTISPAELIAYRYEPYAYAPDDKAEELSLTEGTLIRDVSQSKKIISKDELKSLKKEVQRVKETKGSNPGGMAIASLVLGIVSLFVAGLPLGILAVIFGSISMRRLEKGNGRGMAIAGLILGLVGILGALIILTTMV